MVFWWIIQGLVVYFAGEAVVNYGIGRSGMKKLDRNMDIGLETIRNMLMHGNSDFGIPTMKEIEIFDNIVFATE